MAPGRFAAPVVTFDKGGRVARLEEGAHLDDRQVGILLAQLGKEAGRGRRGHLLEWDRTRDPATNVRMEGLLASRGPDHKQTLLLALSMGVLVRFQVDDLERGERFVLTGTRSDGYRVVASEKHGAP